MIMLPDCWVAVAQPSSHHLALPTAISLVRMRITSRCLHVVNYIVTDGACMAGLGTEQCPPPLTAGSRQRYTRAVVSLEAIIAHLL